MSHTEPWWIATRATAYAALVAYTAAALIGWAFATKGAHRIKQRHKLAIHVKLSIAATGLLFAHLATAALDRRHVPPYAMIAPFASPTRTTAAGYGSIATYGMLIVAATAHRKTTWWRKIHWLAFPAIGFAYLHTAYGSDPVGLGAITLAAAGIAGIFSITRRSRQTRRHRGHHYRR